MSSKKDRTSQFPPSPFPGERGMPVGTLTEMLGWHNPKRPVRVIVDDTDGPLSKTDGAAVIDVAAESSTVWLVVR
jgi:hypothetical protein